MTRLFDLDIQLFSDVILMAVAVFFLFLFLSKLFFYPVRGMMIDRQNRIAGELSGAATDRKAAAALKDEYTERLKEVDQESELLLSEARQKARKNAERIEGEAREEADHILQRAKQETELAKKQMLNEVKQEMIAAAALMAAKVVAANINTSIQNTLVEETLREMGDSTWQS